VRILHGFRPVLPSSRAQDLQVVHTCHALATRGHQVTVLANVRPGAPLSAGEALAAVGLEPVEGLDLRLAPTSWNPGASLWFRWWCGEWTERADRDAVVYLRELRYLGLLGERPRVVYEAHCLERQREAEEEGDVGLVEAWERAALGRSQAVVANSGGTLAALREAYGAAMPPLCSVIHNATRAGPPVAWAPAVPARVAYGGSTRSFKGVEGLLAAMSDLPDVELRLFGGIVPPGSPPNVRAVPTVPYAAMAAELAACRVLVLPLVDNSFGRQFTSPLKLWDYLATGSPIVAADLPTVREIAGEAPFYYPPGDVSGMVAALRHALRAGPRLPRVRTWADRAAEIEQVLLAARESPRRRG
jgi:glycosyltransferase involved in cell wall biosynthesis